MKLSTLLRIVVIYISCQTDLISGTAATRQIIAPKDVDLSLHDRLDGGGVMCSYSDNMEQFSKVTEASGACGIPTVMWVCVQKGVFVLYKDENYMADSLDDVHVLSGVSKCIVPSNENRILGSIRVAGNQFYDPEKSSFITIAKDKYYSGSALYSVDTKSDRDLETMVPVRSLIIAGRDKWSVTTLSGGKYCLTPVMQDPNKIATCVVPDTEELKEHGLADLMWTEIVRGCDSGDEISIKTCYDYESGELHNIAIASAIPDPTPRKDNTSDVILMVATNSNKSPFTDDNCESSDEIAFLLRSRLTYDFNNPFQFLLPLDKKHVWRSELFDMAIEVAGVLVPDDIVDETFLVELREFFIYFLEKVVWAKGDAWPDKPILEYRIAVHETRSCMKKLEEDPMLEPFQQRVSEIFKNVPQFFVPPELISDKLTRVEWLDKLMEAVWVILNLVGATCHNVKIFETNFWIDFMALANDLYLEPMIPLWTEVGGMAGKYYDILFGGHNLNFQIDALAFVATEMFKTPRNFEVYPRPEATKTGKLG